MDIEIAVLLILISIELLIIIWKLGWNDDRILGIEMSYEDFSRWIHDDLKKLWEKNQVSRGIVFNELSRLDRFIIWLIKIRRGAK